MMSNILFVNSFIMDFINANKLLHIGSNS